MILVVEIMLRLYWVWLLVSDIVKFCYFEVLGKFVIYYKGFYVERCNFVVYWFRDCNLKMFS